MNNIQENIHFIKNKIHTYEKKYHREEGSVSLLAVSKHQSITQISEAIAAGQMAFGESYLQESLEKMAVLSDKKVEWHFIGPIQSNKTKKIAENFFWVHSVENFRIAQRLHDQRPANLPPLNICLQINLSAEKTKSGVSPTASFDLIEHCLGLSRLNVRGLMTIPAPQHSFADQRTTFHELTKLFNKLREKGISLDTLSMGMSDDFEAAIAEGSSIVRIGTGIFGARI